MLNKPRGCAPSSFLLSICASNISEVQLTNVPTLDGNFGSLGAQELLQAESHLVHTCHNRHGPPDNLGSTKTVRGAEKPQLPFPVPVRTRPLTGHSIYRSDLRPLLGILLLQDYPSDFHVVPAQLLQRCKLLWLL